MHTMYGIYTCIYHDCILGLHSHSEVLRLSIKSKFWPWWYCCIYCSCILHPDTCSRYSGVYFHSESLSKQHDVPTRTVTKFASGTADKLETAQIGTSSSNHDALPVVRDGCSELYIDILLYVYQYHYACRPQAAWVNRSTPAAVKSRLHVDTILTLMQRIDNALACNDKEVASDSFPSAPYSRGR